MSRNTKQNGVISGAAIFFIIFILIILITLGTFIFKPSFFSKEKSESKQSVISTDLNNNDTTSKDNNTSTSTTSPTSNTSTTSDGTINTNGKSTTEVFTNSLWEGAK